MTGRKRGVGRPALLTRDQVARAAFDLVDAEGGAALTMPRLARELGVGTMTLYGYAKSKDEIVGMLPDLLLVELPDSDPDGPWMEVMESLYLAAFQRLIEHGNVTRLIAGAPVFGHAQARVLEGVLECLERNGFAPQEAFALQRTVGTYTIGYAMFALAEAGPGDRPRVSWTQDLGAEDFPRLAEVSSLLTAPGDETEFLTGLRGILASPQWRAEAETPAAK